MYDKGYPRAAVSAIIRNAEGKILFLQNAVCPYFKGSWSLPGGIVEGGQSWNDALKRIVLLQLGIQIVHQRLIGIYSDPSVNIHTDASNGEKYPLLVSSFLVSHYDGEIVLKNKESRLDWYRHEFLPPGVATSEPVKVMDAMQFKGTCFVR